MKETWKQNCLALNNVIANKDKTLKYIVSVPTGSVKTENIITYCAMLPKKITVLIRTNLTDEADRLVEKINNEANDNRAYTYHSKNDLKIEEAAEYQVIIVTHSFYKIFFRDLKNGKQ